ncbi:MAG: TolC family protein [Bacteroidetes bacterium]|nr:TolC family protein [Bacteroidota bacterium]
MKKNNLSTIPLFFLFFAISVNAQTLSLEDCIKAGLDNSRQLALNNSAIQQNLGKVKEVAAMKLPQLKFLASYSRLSDIPNSEIKLPFLPSPVVLQEPVLNNYALRLSLSQPLFTGHRLSSQEKSVEISTEALRADNEIIKNDEAIKTIAAYYNLAAANEQLAVIEENITTLKKRLSDANDFYKNGLITRNDILKIEVQISNTLSKKIDAETAILAAKAQLNLAIGRSVDSPIEINKFSWEEPAAAIDFATLKESAEANRGEFKTLAIKHKVLEENMNVAKAGYLPEIYLGSNLYYTNPSQRIFPQKDEFRATWDVSLSLQWNVWDWGATSAKVDQATENIKSLGTTKQQLSDAVSNEVYQNYLQYTSARSKLKNLETTLEQANENYRVTLENFNAQVATAADLLEADNSLFAAKTSLQLAKISIVMSGYKLLKSTGKRLY